MLWAFEEGIEKVYAVYFFLYSDSKIFTFLITFDQIRSWRHPTNAFSIKIRSIFKKIKGKVCQASTELSMFVVYVLINRKSEHLR